MGDSEKLEQARYLIRHFHDFIKAEKVKVDLSILGGKMYLLKESEKFLAGQDISMQIADASEVGMTFYRGESTDSKWFDTKDLNNE